MKKGERKASRPPGLRAEYDFTNGIRGKYADRVGATIRVVVLDPRPRKRRKAS